MNRDEADSRAEAGEHLEKHIDGHLKQWWPIDSVSGGTWFGLRGDGLVACLLNRYQGRSATPIKSRGLIIPTLFQQDHAHPTRWIAEQCWDKYASFDLIVVSNLGISQCSWDDGRMHIQEHNEESSFFLSSSSSEYEKSLSVRHGAFEEFRTQHASYEATQIISDLHHQTGDDATLGFLMRRTGRKTKSISQALAASQQPWHRYLPLA